MVQLKLYNWISDGSMEIKRIDFARVGDLTYNELNVTINRLFNTKSYKLKYVDQDEELICLDSDADLALAMAINSTVKVVVFDSSLGKTPYQFKQLEFWSASGGNSTLVAEIIKILGLSKNSTHGLSNDQRGDVPKQYTQQIHTIPGSNAIPGQAQQIHSQSTQFQQGTPLQSNPPQLQQINSQSNQPNLQTNQLNAQPNQLNPQSNQLNPQSNQPPNHSHGNTQGYGTGPQYAPSSHWQQSNNYRPSTPQQTPSTPVQPNTYYPPNNGYYNQYPSSTQPQNQPSNVLPPPMNYH
ncbi:hypothetical protein BC833DRAFT_605234 [Globomyces pollinis-pini]|nr:hypothetical protein BC833DRAFT_605234 [Globomyces pollinis-pini]